MPKQAQKTSPIKGYMYICISIYLEAIDHIAAIISTNLNAISIVTVS